MLKNFIGLDGFVWWLGIVENRIDPLNLGRCQVRIFGWHTDDTSLVPSGDLPWAMPMMPITSVQTVTLKEGDMVAGFFVDANSAQQPVIMGLIPGIPAVTPPDNKGFSDQRTLDQLSAAPKKPNDRQYRTDGWGMVITEGDASRYPNVLNEPTTSKYSRNENVVSHRNDFNSQLDTLSRHIASGLTGGSTLLSTLSSIFISTVGISLTNSLTNSLLKALPIGGLANIPGLAGSVARAVPGTVSAMAKNIALNVGSGVPLNQAIQYGVSSSLLSTTNLLVAPYASTLTTSINGVVTPLTNSLTTGLNSATGALTSGVTATTGILSSVTNKMVGPISGLVANDVTNLLPGTAGTKITTMGGSDLNLLAKSLPTNIANQYTNKLLGTTFSPNTFAASLTSNIKNQIASSVSGGMSMSQALAQSVSSNIASNSKTFTGLVTGNLTSQVTSGLVGGKTLERSVSDALSKNITSSLIGDAANITNLSNGVTSNLLGGVPLGDSISQSISGALGTSGINDLVSGNLTSKINDLVSAGVPLDSAISQSVSNILINDIIGPSNLTTSNQTSLIQERIDNVAIVPTVGGMWIEPETKYAPVFPYNKVTETESGHLQEFDDTPYAERISTTHRSGTFEEIHPNGSKVTKVVRNNYKIVMSDDNVCIMGDCNITVQGNASLYVMGNHDVKVDGNYTVQVGGNYNMHVGGNSMWYTALNKSIVSTLHIGIDAPKVDVLSAWYSAVVGKYNMIAATHDTISATYSEEISGQYVRVVGGNASFGTGGNYTSTVGATIALSSSSVVNITAPIINLNGITNLTEADGI